MVLGDPPVALTEIEPGSPSHFTNRVATVIACIKLPTVGIVAYVLVSWFVVAV